MESDQESHERKHQRIEQAFGPAGHLDERECGRDEQRAELEVGPDRGAHPAQARALQALEEPGHEQHREAGEREQLWRAVLPGVAEYAEGGEG